MPKCSDTFFHTKLSRHMIAFEERTENEDLLYRRQEVQSDCLGFQFVAWCAVGKDYVVEGRRHVQSKYVKFYNSPRWTLIASVNMWHFFFCFQNAIDRQTAVEKTKETRGIMIRVEVELSKVWSALKL